MWVGIAFKETIKLPLNIEGKWSVEWTFRVDEPQTKSSRHHRPWHSASGGKWYIDLMEAERLRPSRTSSAAELLHTRRTGWINCDGTRAARRTACRCQNWDRHSTDGLPFVCIYLSLGVKADRWVHVTLEHPWQHQTMTTLALLACSIFRCRFQNHRAPAQVSIRSLEQLASSRRQMVSLADCLVTTFLPGILVSPCRCFK